MPLERGTSSFARGGANIVDVGDPGALYLNPASLAGLEGLQLLVDVNWHILNPRFTRAPDDLDDDGTLETYPEVSSRKYGRPSPGIFATYSLRRLGLPATIGAAFYAPVGGSNVWPADGPQRYTTVRGDTITLFLGGGAAFELPWWNIRLGGTLLGVKPRLKTKLAFNLAMFSTPEDPRYDVIPDFEAGDGWAMTGALGISLRPLPWLAFGAAYQFGIPVEDTGTISVDFGEAAEVLGSVKGDRIYVSTRIPAMVRTGVRYLDPDGRFDVELAFVWEEWSAYKNIAVEPRDVYFETIFGQSMEIPNFDLVNGYRDTYSFRLGGQWRVSDAITLRSGVWYERSAVAQNNLSAAAVELNNIGIAAGLRHDFWGRFWYDVAVGYKHGFTAEVTESDIYLIDLLQDPPEKKWPVANGTYRVWNVLLMAGLGVRFDI
jgi:long-chain fatty acid transport protein